MLYSQWQIEYSEITLRGRWRSGSRLTANAWTLSDNRSINFVSKSISDRRAGHGGRMSGQLAGASTVSCHGVYGGPGPVKREALTMRDHVHSPPAL